MEPPNHGALGCRLDPKALVPDICLYNSAIYTRGGDFPQGRSGEITPATPGPGALGPSPAGNAVSLALQPAARPGGSRPRDKDPDRRRTEPEEDKHVGKLTLVSPGFGFVSEPDAAVAARSRPRSIAERKPDNEVASCFCWNTPQDKRLRARARIAEKADKTDTPLRHWARRDRTRDQRVQSRHPCLKAMLGAACVR